ncbi:serine/threonine protein kinase, CMGC, CDC2/CDK sub [Coemansia brasiliensis]|uniref:Serine/threonine protein kinase, CMGC, CDC2/CDK sub n=1 Tax=Coemansia brasiliensis TaxID=2650707 RepID=A0A9W8IJN3_9FUNG|nr:serine/threonine protein kinase, CMGC, CDC2/CDK sub [Coemansia brasiliensis]
MSVPRPDLVRNASQQVPMSSSASSNSNTPSPPRTRRRDGKKFVGCSPFEDYELTTKLGEGTFGEVHKAVHKATGAVVALKRVLMHNEKEGLPITAIREIKLLKSLHHPNIVPLADMLVKHESHGSGQPPSVYMVFPYMDHDLTGLLENPKIHLRQEHIKLYLRQLLEGTAYLHASKVMHRDMKASNLLINNEGRLFIADFGLARAFNPDDKKDMTKCVVTRWYRPPELLLGERKYTTAIDMWGIGCIFAEMLVGKPVFQGSTDLNQIDQVMRVCGSPNNALWPGWRDLPDCKQVEDFNTYPRRVREEFARFGDDAADLLDQLLQLDPRRRPTAAAALKHRLFFTSPFPARPEDMPTFEHSHEFDRRKHRQHQRANPETQPHAPPHRQPSQPRNQSDAYSRYSGQYQSQYSPAHRRDSGRYGRREDYGRSGRNDGQRDGRRNFAGGGARATSRSRNGYHPYSRSNGNYNQHGSDTAGWRQP